MVLFGIHGRAERIRQLLEIKYDRHVFIIYIDTHREYAQGDPHGVLHVTSINLYLEVLFWWTHSEILDD